MPTQDCRQMSQVRNSWMLLFPRLLVERGTPLQSSGLAIQACVDDSGQHARRDPPGHKAGLARYVPLPLPLTSGSLQRKEGTEHEFQ